MAEPCTITAGDTATWTRLEPSYPASAGWALTYYLSADATAPKTVTATADGDGYTATVSATDSARWAAGDYHWTARVVKGTEIHTVGTGVFRVLPDPTTTFDRRTNAEKIAAAIEAALVTGAGNLIVEYELPDGLKVKKDRPAALKELGMWRTQVRMERGGAFGVPILVGFNRHV